MATAKVGRNFRLNNDPRGYIGRNLRTLKDISGVAAGGNVTVTFDVDNRKFGARLYTVAVNYTGGAGLATKHLTGGGNDALTVTPTLVNREPTAVAVVAAGNGYNVGDTFQLVDATGLGAVFTVATLTAGAGSGVATATYNAGSAAASAVEPDFVIPTFQLGIGATVPYQVDTQFYASRRQACGLISELGVLNIDFADPSRNWLTDNDVTSWDTVGANTMKLTAKINPLAVKPGITGDEEFDFRRNSFENANGLHLFANPFKLVQQTVDLVAGVTPIKNLTTFGKLARLWVKNQTTPGTISFIQFEIDGITRLEGNVADIFRKYREYGFKFGDKDNYVAATIGTSNTLKGLLNPFNYFDAAYIADYDGREVDAILVPGHNLQLTSSVAQKATIYMEFLPGRFI